MSQPSPNSSAFWMPAAKLRRVGGKKLREDAVLMRLQKPAQELVAEWATRKEADADGNAIEGTGTVKHALARLAEMAVQAGRPELAVGSSTLYKFLDWFSLSEDLDASQAVEDQVFTKTGDRKKARAAGEVLLLRLGIARQDRNLITAAMAGEDSRRSLDLQERSGETKAKQKDRQLAQKDQDLKLAREKFQRDTCELFLKWQNDERAKAIAGSNATNAEKIEQLGLAMFGEDWHS